MKNFLFILLCLGIFFQADAACKRKKRKKKTQTQQVTAKDSVSNILVVSFISKASGIDRTAAEHMEIELEKFNGENTKKIIMNVVPWGREGERDYCFNSESQLTLNKFAAILKNKFKGNDRIFVTENGKCREKRR